MLLPRQNRANASGRKSLFRCYRVGLHLHFVEEGPNLPQNGRWSEGLPKKSRLKKLACFFRKQGGIKSEKERRAATIDLEPAVLPHSGIDALRSLTHTVPFQEVSSWKSSRQTLCSLVLLQVSRATMYCLKPVKFQNSRTF